MVRNNQLVKYKHEPDPNSEKGYATLSAEWIALHGTPKTISDAIQMASYVGGEALINYIEEQVTEGAQMTVNYVKNTAENWYSNFMSEDYGKDNPALREPQRMLEYETPQQLAKRYNTQISPANKGETRLAKRSKNSQEMQTWQEPSQSDLQSEETMEPTGEIQQRSMSSSTTGQSGSTETAITQANPVYGYQNTYTAKMRASVWCLAVKPSYAQPVAIELKLNTPKNIFRPQTYVVSTAGGTANGGTVHNHNKADTVNFGTMDATLIPFPATLPATPVVTANMWKIHSEQYQYYTVLKCYYKISMQNISTASHQGVTLLYGYDTYGASNTNGTKYPRNITYWQARSWENLREIRIPSRSNPEMSSNGIVILEGTYVPGQAKRGVMNDGDVKRWTKRADGFPSY